MLKEFKQHIETKFPFLKNAKLLLACSGGVDSVVLAQLLRKLKYTFDMAHCNYKLRGTESDEDEQFVKDLASELEAKVFTKDFDLTNITGSVQAKARELRYGWFESLCEAYAYDYVLTGHHADDSLETFVINLSRGTGIDGLSGIPSQNRNIIRPLLVFSRETISQFAEEEWVVWRDDASNIETKYLRNQIRHKIVPELKKLHSNFLENFQQTQELLQGSANLLNAYQKALKERMFKTKGDILKINCNELLQLHPVGPHLHLLFKEYGFTDFDALKILLHTASGKQLFSKTHRLVKDRSHLLLGRRKHEKIETYFIPEEAKQITAPISMMIQNVASIEKSSRQVIYVDKEKLNYPLLLRRWQNGDYFYPLGMKGKKKISKFFKDEKFDLFSKEGQWLLCSNDQIVWVVGHRADERFKATPKTKNIIKITLTE